MFGENFPSSLTYLFLHNLFESFGSIWVHLQVLSGVRVAQSLVFYVMSCRSLLVIFSFSFWSLYCLSFFYLGLLVTRLVSSSLILLFTTSGYPFGIFKLFLTILNQGEIWHYIRNNVICQGLFNVQLFEMRGDCSFVLLIFGELLTITVLSFYSWLLFLFIFQKDYLQVE